jgi:hypothetical protein
MMDTVVSLQKLHRSDTDQNAIRREYKVMFVWLSENNIKFSIQKDPAWSWYIETITMSGENATAFKLRFDL